MVAPILPRSETIELSEDYEIVIPRSLRESLGLRPGQKLQVIFYEGRIELVPEIDPDEAFGSMPDLDTNVGRDEEDRV